ncbi:MAG: hypothetical protein LQ337_006257 [Flavoplaca oasis]|nr:MAG: hypothetical protein LQ337_006257 [Flavoplaca oasis]
MAPLLKIFIQWLPTLPGTLKSKSHGQSTIEVPSFSEVYEQQYPINPPQAFHDKAIHTLDEETKQISSVSWGKDHLDIFGFNGENLTHKYWDGNQWNPSDHTMEQLGHGLATRPVSISWGTGRLDIFGLDEDGTILHQYYDGTAWKPDVAEFERLGKGCNPSEEIAASTWGPDSLDVFCRDPKDEQILHQYYNGHGWSELELFGGDVAIGPRVVSWGKNHMAVFFLDSDGEVNQRYWDGSQWSNEWDTFTNPKDYKFDTLSVSSWGENRIDVWAAERNSGLWHLYWDGHQWSEWECLSGPDDEPIDHVSVASWSVNKLDVVTLGRDDRQYRYKFYDGASWQPSVSGWYDRPGVEFESIPSVISWGPNRLDIFGVTADDKLLHQAWTGYDWYPGDEKWETLSEPHKAEAKSKSSSYGQESIEIELRV